MKTIRTYLYFWVLLGIVLGGLVGYFSPHLGVALKPLADGFITLIKMLIAPLIFCTIVLGIAQAENLKKVGFIGIKTLIYFEIVSTLALIIGLFVVNIWQPGKGFNVDPKTLDASAIASYAHQAAAENVPDFILNIIPKTITDAFTNSGNLLQVILLALLFGFALMGLGEKGKRFLGWIDDLNKILFEIVNFIMYLAPIGAFGAMAFTIGKYGTGALWPLLNLMGSFYLTCILFIGIVLGSIAALCGFNIFRFLAYIKTELLTVLGTSSSETALLPLMQKLQRLGCSPTVVGLVVPTGYSFNLDGTNIYLTMAAIFVAQALNIHLTLIQELTLLLVAMLTSKGASGVTGAGFVTLAATLSVVPSIPLAGLTLILGIDRFMSEARSLTNIIGNGVGAIVIARWQGELDCNQLQQELKPPQKQLIN